MYVSCGNICTCRMVRQWVFYFSFVICDPEFELSCNNKLRGPEFNSGNEIMRKCLHTNPKKKKKTIYSYLGGGTYGMVDCNYEKNILGLNSFDFFSNFGKIIHILSAVCGYA